VVRNGLDDISTAHAAMMAAYPERLQQEQGIKILGEESLEFLSAGAQGFLTHVTKAG
jgi:hypothetical protein